MKDIAQWTAPSPLWPAAVDDIDDPSRIAFRQPAILRFATDSFMDDFMATLRNDPTRLVEYLAQPETWRRPQKSPLPPAPLKGFDLRLERLHLAGARRALGSALPVPSGKQAFAETKQKRVENPLKLYQPSQQRFYLIAACCVCHIAGLPDKSVDVGRAESTTFVLRRLFEKKSNPPVIGAAKEFVEYGFVVTAQGSSWKKVKVEKGAPVGLVKGEDQLPLFSVSLTESDERKRRLLSAVIPVARREAYMGAPLSNGNGVSESSGNGTTKKTARKILFRTLVTEPWKALITLAEDAREQIAEGASSANKPGVKPEDKAVADKLRVSLLKSTREQIQTAAWLLLLDFSDYLRQYLPEVWTAIKDAEETLDTLTRPQIDLVKALELTRISSNLSGVLLVPRVYVATNVASNLRDALRRMIDFDGKNSEKARNLEKVTGSYDRSEPDPLWPPFLFPLADPAEDAPQIPDVVGVTLEPDNEQGINLPVLVKGDKPDELVKRENIDKLVGYLVKALPVESSAQEPPTPLADIHPHVEPDGLFTIRCVYARPACGPLEPPVVSDQSARFQMAGFFDPDAPARAIRIPLPIDMSPAGLRKHDKNSAFMISDILCGQIGRFKKFSLGDLVLSVLPWPFYKPLDLSAPDQGPCVGGDICSLSIPYITICALILLLVIATLFHSIFWWLPWFIKCTPLPGFKAKKAS
jgi:hypothetical protein